MLFVFLALNNFFRRWITKWIYIYTFLRRQLLQIFATKCLTLHNNAIFNLDKKVLCIRISRDEEKSKNFHQDLFSLHPRLKRRITFLGWDWLTVLEEFLPQKITCWIIWYCRSWQSFIRKIKTAIVSRSVSRAKPRVTYRGGDLNDVSI